MVEVKGPNSGANLIASVKTIFGIYTSPTPEPASYGNRTFSFLVPKGITIEKEHVRLYVSDPIYQIENPLLSQVNQILEQHEVCGTEFLTQASMSAVQIANMKFSGEFNLKNTNGVCDVTTKAKAWTTGGTFGFSVIGRLDIYD